MDFCWRELPNCALSLLGTHRLMPVEITNADRVIFPDDGITKGDVVAYYALVADRMLPFITGRALTVERFPRGIGAKGFMQKNAPIIIRRTSSVVTRCPRRREVPPCIRWSTRQTASSTSPTWV